MVAQNTLHSRHHSRGGQNTKQSAIDRIVGEKNATQLNIHGVKAKLERVKA
jgi:hypothetical protein